MKKILEINPLECPKCKDTMRIVAFIQDPFEISKIIKSLDIPPQVPTPISRAPRANFDAPNYDLIDDTYDD